jgi:hypothetical protein
MRSVSLQIWTRSPTANGMTELDSFWPELAELPVLTLVNTAGLNVHL